MALSKKENGQLEVLQNLQANSNRWFTQEEFDRLKFLRKKKFKGLNPFVR